MDTPLVQISQGDRDIGWGRLGTLMPKGESGSEITLYDVQIAEGAGFEIGGPFRITVEDKRFDQCRPVNFRNLRPGSDYERVIFETDQKPRLG